ncbi:putative insecticidal toxin complex [Yersinia pekkanenii]|nr:putative insecticidal toxin complex [Yersinia pekkanenii]
MPWLGRWLSSDPAGTIYGLNLYRMVRNNPISLMDEDGLKPHDRKQGFIYSPFSDMGALEQIVGKNAQRILNKKQIMPIIVDTEKQKKELLLNLKSVLLSEGKATALTKILGIIDQMDGGEPPQYSALSEAVAPSNFKVSSLEKTTALKNLDPSQHKLLLIGHGSAGVPALSNDDEKSIRTFKELAENFKSSGLPMNFSDIKLTSCHSGDDNIIIGSIIPPGESLDEAPAQYFANELGKIGYKEVRVYGYRGMGDRFTLANNIHKTRSIISSSGKKQRGEQVCIVIYSRIKI